MSSSGNSSGPARGSNKCGKISTASLNSHSCDSEGKENLRNSQLLHSKRVSLSRGISEEIEITTILIDEMTSIEIIKSCYCIAIPGVFH